MKTFKTLLKTELKLSLRGMDMLIFAICMPVVVISIIGMIYGHKPAFEGADYTFLEQSFGAVTTIAICAGGVMGLPLVISDYRHKKLLKRFQVSPMSPALLLGVQVVIYALYAVASLLLVYATARLCFGFQMRGSWLQFLGAYLLVMLSVFSLGLMVGGIAKDIKSASTIASLLYFPMLIFSGATVPYEMLPAALQKIVNFMPLTQGIKLLKAAVLNLPVGNIIVPIVFMSVMMAVCTVAAIRYFKWE